jgi:Arc/MetJ-type ribon-helix-helix transcriptional regulator
MFTITSLGSGLDVWVGEQVSSGRFTTEAEVFFEAMRLFRETIEDPEVGRAVLTAQIKAGLRGPFYPAAKVFDEVEAELRVNIASKDAA